jgi:hypothetical protein
MSDPEERDQREEARQAWPLHHPMRCPICGAEMTTPDGIALVDIDISYSGWKCRSHMVETVGEPIDGR